MNGEFKSCLKAVFFLFLIVSAWQDMRKGSISEDVFLFSALAGISLRGAEVFAKMLAAEGGIVTITAGMAAGKTLDIAAGMGLGALLLFLSHATGEAVGKGDGWFFLISGMYLGFWKNLLLLTGALFLCFPVGAVLFIRDRWVRQNSQSTSLPFLPFVFLVGIGVLFL